VKDLIVYQKMQNVNKIFKILFIFRQTDYFLLTKDDYLSIIDMIIISGGQNVFIKIESF